MKKFGFGRKGDGEDPNRGALFGRSKKSSSAAENPYAAQQGGRDPYADEAKYANMSPYQQARAGVNNGNNSNNSPQQSNPYGAPNQGGAPAAAGGYGADRFGTGAGYGANRYDTGPSQNQYNAPAASARGPGGYGGFGRSEEPDSNRDALFSGTQERHAQKQQAPAAAGGYGQPDQAGADSSYGGYGEQRQLTAEEQEEADYQSILAEKRQLQQESASSVSRSVQIAQQANEVGRATLARLGAQGERLNNTEKHLDIAANQNKVAQDRASELKTLNRSMFAVHVSNPFTSKQRQMKADEDVMNRHRTERADREATRKDGFVANQRMEGTFRDINAAGNVRPKARKKDYGKYNLDDEEGADELEDQIDEGINELEGQVKMMNMVGRAIGKEVDAQNKQIDRIANKSDAVDDATRMNRERLNRIK